MLLVYTQNKTSRTTYIFKQICTRILGLEVDFTGIIEEFIAFKGPKISYGKQPLGNELFIAANGLLERQGFESIEPEIIDWEGTVCIFPVSDNSALPFDIFAASFFLLSRYDEYLPHVKQDLGGITAHPSLATRGGFLLQPVVDIWAKRFGQLLVENFPQIEMSSKKYSIHNLIYIDEPFKYRQKGFFRTFIGFTNDLGRLRLKNLARRTKTMLGIRKDPYDNYNWIIDSTKTFSGQLSVFFSLGKSHDVLKGFNSQRTSFKMSVKNLADYHRVGLIVSSPGNVQTEVLKSEIRELERITNRELEACISSNFEANLPILYRQLVELEIAEDHSLAYENALGFRSGTCTPYFFYDLEYETQIPLKIHPVCGTTMAFNDRYTSTVAREIDQLLSNVKEVNGTFSFLFNNADFSMNANGELWRSVLLKTLSANDQ